MMPPNTDTINLTNINTNINTNIICMEQNDCTEKIINISSDERKWTVYCHTSPSGKKYIGITCLDVEKRWLNGKGYKTQIYFSRAIDKYSWDNIKHEILYIDLSQEDAEKIEGDLIKTYNTQNRKYGYNLRSGGNVSTHSPESIKKVSDAKKGIKFTEEHKRMLSIAAKEKSDAAKEKTLKTAFKKGNVPWNTGKEHSPETRSKMSEAKLGKEPWNKGKTGVYSEEKKQEMGAKNKGRTMSPESSRKKREAMIKYWEEKKTRQEI